MHLLLLRCRHSVSLVQLPFRLVPGEADFCRLSHCTQALAAPPLLAGSNVVIAAETGSGKTFAYLAPLASRLLDLQMAQPPRGPSVLVLCPNSQLAEQVAAAANSLLSADGSPLLPAAALSPARVGIVLIAVCGRPHTVSYAVPPLRDDTAGYVRGVDARPFTGRAVCVF